MLVFREVRQLLAGVRLLESLQCELHSMAFASGQHLKDALVSSLLRAGELECALADDDSPHLPRMMQVTDVLSEALLDPKHSLVAVAQASSLCNGIEAPFIVRVSPPEGFCYYGIHPLDYVDLLKSEELPGSAAGVIGIRSIGTTLSSVVTAVLRKRTVGRAVERMTVRPSGHPFDRAIRFSEEETAFVRRLQQRSGTFYVVDEGPGLSGSTFLSVGDALRSLGVPTENILFVSSRSVDAKDLIAPDAEWRWNSYRSMHAKFTRQVPEKAEHPIHWGEWRKEIFTPSLYTGTPYADEQNWPSVWMSNPRFLSKDRGTLFKYEGLGRYGAAVCTRAAVIGEAGFGPNAQAAGDGFTAYPFLKGAVLSAEDISEGLLHQIANYIAFRAGAFRASHVDPLPLETMVRHNFHQITGTELAKDFCLEVVHPVITDSRMMPHEWLLPLRGDCRLLKLDAAAHGDGHFFPGPCDIAWDLAGTIVEWGLTPDAAGCLLNAYHKASGDNAQERVHDYVIAYAAFQAGYYAMAAEAMRAHPETKLLLRDKYRYTAMLARCNVQSRLQVA